ncbi:MAG: NYN domain-containing protein [Pseudomonadota bacterium]
MASSNDNVSMALFCDFENVALGVRDANYEKFDIKPVLERLLLKGSIVVKKAYCDWDRYKAFKAPMHEANFELIEIPHVRQSGKNSADIRMVVDALDLCYTKSHVNTFVIISGDSDFSPLVSKLRENAKKVIGVGVKQSTSDLLVANCDEFIFYDDLVRESRRAAAKRDPREGQPAVKRSPEEEKRRRDDMDKRRSEAVDMAVETFDALVSERGDSGKIWASVLKEAIKRRKPDFSESYYGFRTFGNLLEEAKARGLLEFGRDEKSGAYVYRSSGGASSAGGEQGAGTLEATAEVAETRHPEGRRGRGRGGRRGSSHHQVTETVPEEVAAELRLASDENAYAEAEAVHAAQDAQEAQDTQDEAPVHHQPWSNHANHANHAADAAEVAEAEEVEPVVEETVPPVVAEVAPKRKSAPKKPARALKAEQAKAAAKAAQANAASPWPQSVPEAVAAVIEVAVPAAEPVQLALDVADVSDAVPKAKGRSRAPAKGRGKQGESRITAAAAEAAAATDAPHIQHAPHVPNVQHVQHVQHVPEAVPATPVAPGHEASADSQAESAAKPARKPSTRGPRRPRKPDAKQGG